jgi:hypothetical protein
MVKDLQIPDKNLRLEKKLTILLKMIYRQHMTKRKLKMIHKIQDKIEVMEVLVKLIKALQALL